MARSVTETTPFDEVREEMLADGFSPSAPDRTTAEEDAEMVTDWPCGNCGQQDEPLLYMPFVQFWTEVTTRRRRAEYRPYALCTVCGVGEEF